MQMNRCILAALLASAGAAAQGQVIITEIMANEFGTDVPGEWAEIYNAGIDPVDISGWRFADEDGNSPSDPFPDGFIIQPGEAVVVAASGVQDGLNAAIITDADFFASWGLTNADGNTYRVIIQDDAITLANTPSPTNEVLTLIDAQGITVDVANYENGTNGWPATPNGASITLGPNFLDDFANDFGCAWSRAVLGIEGVVVSTEVITLNGNGVATIALSAENYGSPGYVPPAGSFVDCNNNGVADGIDICNGVSQDCNGNGIPDECENDCNGNGIADTCDIQGNFSIDCDVDAIIDSCEIAGNPALDANNNGKLDLCEQFEGLAIITEIMFDPATSADEMEYVEILNVSGAPLDISGWYIRDIEGTEDITDAVPAGTVLPTGGIAVLTRSTTGDVNETRQDYIDAWGANTPAGNPILWIPLENWGARATFGTDITEVCSILSAAGTVVDTVNYINRTSNSEPLPGGWPGGDGHGSYYLAGNKLNASDNDFGPNWRLSIDGLSGARRSNDFDPMNPPSWVNPDSGGEDYGTPGYIYAGAPEQPSGTVVITEILATGGAVFPGADPMDPLAPAGVDEWVEIYNTTGATIDLSGWYLQDEDGRTTGFPNGSTLEAGEVAVIYGGADFPTEIPDPAGSFYDAWGCDYKIFVVSEWYTNNKNFGLGRLSDSPNFVNEILRLVDASGKPVDIVNYDDDAFDWPVDGTGVATDNNWSIYIIDPSDFNGAANDNGTVWADSLEPIDGARSVGINDVFNAVGFTYGSPGFLLTVQDPDLMNCDVNTCVADVNGDGILSPADFTAWIAAFNAMSAGCDQNDDGSCTPSDFTAWIANFNAGC